MNAERVYMEHCHCECGHEFTAERDPTRDGALSCPRCGSQRVHVFRTEQMRPVIAEQENDDD